MNSARLVWDPFLCAIHNLWPLRNLARRRENWPAQKSLALEIGANLRSNAKNGHAQNWTETNPTFKLSFEQEATEGTTEERTGLCVLCILLFTYFRVSLKG